MERYLDKAELRTLIALAGPGCGSYLLQMGMGVANVVTVGQLGVLELDGAALGQLIANITGFSLVVGLLMAMDTLAPQAYGSGNNKLVGSIAQRAVLISAVSCTQSAACRGFASCF